MKPIWKWLIGIILTLLLLFFSGFWYISNHWRPILNEKLHEVILRSSDSLYNIQYDNLDFNLVTGNAEVTNFKLIPDTNVYDQLKRQQKAPDNLYTISVSKLLVRDFHPKLIYTEGRLNIEQILIESPEIRVVNETQTYNDTLKPKDKRSLYQKISKVLNELAISNIVFKDISLTYTNRNEPEEKTTKLKNVNININDLKVDSLSDVDTMRFYNASSIDLRMDGYRIATGDSLYYVDLNGIHFTSADRTLVLNGLKLTPRYDKINFYKKVKVAKDRFDLSFDTISIGDIDLFKLIKQQKLDAGHVSINQAKVDIFNNKAYPAAKKEPKVGKYPHQQLRKLAFPIKIDRLSLSKAAISYEEYNPKSGQTGKVSFNETSGIFRNVTNDSLALIRNKYLITDIHSKFMNQGKLAVHFEFNLLDTLGAFTCQGVLGPMNARYLNPVVKPLAMIEIHSGYFRRLSFNVRADEHRARGNVQFYYNKLAVNIILKDKEGKKSKNTVISTLTNKFVINDSNPDANEEYHPGPINYKRPPSASFFNFLWKSIFEGVKASVGVSKEKEARIMGTAENTDKAVGKVKRFFKRVFKKKDKK